MKSIATIFPLITFPYVSRVLTPIGTGKVAMATSFVQYFVMFAQLGIPTYGIRAVAKVRNDREKLSKTVHELLIISTITSVIAYLILFILIPTIPLPFSHCSPSSCISSRNCPMKNWTL